MSHFLIFLFFSVAFASVLNADNEAVSSANTTHLHFYLHDVMDGSNRTALAVADGPAMYRGPAPHGFGTIVVTDDVLTDGPNLTSNIVGRAQGFFAYAGISGVEFLYSINIAFIGGEFNGSTVTVFGRDYALEPVRELPIIGGTRKFRMARGYALMKTTTFNLSTGNFELEIDLYISSSSPKMEKLVPSSDGSTSDGDASSSSISTSDGKNNLNLNIVMIFVMCCFLSKHFLGYI